MLNGVVARINGFIAGTNSGLEALGSERRITLLGDLDLGEIENRFARAATRAGTAAKDAFDRAFEDNPLAVPDCGLNDIAREALTSADTYRMAASDLAAGARARLASCQALKDAVAGDGMEGETALDGATDAADRFDEPLQRPVGQRAEQVRLPPTVPKPRKPAGRPPWRPSPFMPPRRAISVAILARRWLVRSRAPKMPWPNLPKPASSTSAALSPR